jgi:hypothetical protein
MISRTVLTTMVAASLASAAWAQDPRVELSASAGWTFSDGVSGTASDAQGNEFARIDPDDAFSWNARLGYLVTPNWEFGVLFGMQSTSLVIGTRNVGDFTLGDQTIYNYHGYFAYNFGDSESVKPYVLLGLGATQYGNVAVNTVALPQPFNDAPQREIEGNTKFSSVWAVGIKVFPSKTFGIRLEGRWTPTYIKSDAAGWWCDPYWGCYTVGDAQYSNQYEVGGGIALRF